METIVVDSFSGVTVGAEVYAVIYKFDSPPIIKKAIVKCIEKFKNEEDWLLDVIVTITYDEKDWPVNTECLFKTEQDAQIQLDRCVEAGEKVDLLFCKLEGECISTEDATEKPDEVKIAYDKAVNPIFMAEILDIQSDGIDFFGEEYYNWHPKSRVGQTNLESGTVRFRSGEKIVNITGRGREIIPLFSVEIVIGREKLSPSRDELLKIDSLCLKIKEILCKDGSKEE